MMTDDISPTLPASRIEMSECEGLLREAATKAQAGHHEKARDIIQRVLRTYPHNPDALHNMGALTVLTGRSLAEAIPYFRSAWEIHPLHSQFGLSYLKALIRTGMPEEAQRIHAEGLRNGLRWPPLDILINDENPGRSNPPVRQGTSPDKAEIQALLGRFEQTDYSGMERLALQITVRYPNHAFGWKALGLALEQQGRAEEALAPLKSAIRLQPEDPESHPYMGNALRALHMFYDAEAAYRTALTLAPKLAQNHIYLAETLFILNRYAEAEESFRQALAIEPEHVEALVGLGLALRGQDRYDEAVASLKNALAIRPDFTVASLDLVDCLKSMARYGEAERYAREGLAHDPRSSELLAALAGILLLQSRIGEADLLCRKILVQDPDDLKARSNRLFISNHFAEESPQSRREEASAWGVITRRQVSAPFSSWTFANASDRLRIGLVSGDLRQHPVGHFLENVLAHSDGQRIEWIAYPTNTKMDALTARLRRHIHGWRPLANLSDEAAARRIHQDGIHILIDLAGHTAYNRLPVFAWRPAPVQVSWLGYFATTGLAEMDYFLADEVGVPPDRQDHFVEKIRYLPDTRLCFTPPDTEEAVSPLPALDRGFLTFGSFQTLAKINDAVLHTWGRILDACPGSRLRLQASALTDENSINTLQSRLLAQGIDPGRVDLHGSTPREDYLKAHAEVDMILDTFPYPGGTTTCEALWMGVPTLTLAGDTLIARQGASLLTAAGLQNWIADSTEDYIASALRFASDLPALAALRAGLREQVRTSPLFDAPRFARNLEDVLWAMWAERKP